jgi:hypothetical protein
MGLCRLRYVAHEAPGYVWPPNIEDPGQWLRECSALQLLLFHRNKITNIFPAFTISQALF